MHGLKENVIAGKLIPAGNGLKSFEEEKSILTKFDVLDTMKEVKQQYIGVHDSEHSLDDDNAEYRNEESLMTEDPGDYHNDKKPNFYKPLNDNSVASPVTNEVETPSEAKVAPVEDTKLQ